MEAPAKVTHLLLELTNLSLQLGHQFTGSAYLLGQFCDPCRGGQHDILQGGGVATGKLFGLWFGELALQEGVDDFLKPSIRASWHVHELLYSTLKATAQV